MKKHFKLYILALTCLLHFSGKSQINYSFTAVGGSFTANSSPTSIHASGTDDAISAAINIGFTFTYGCTAYTQFKASSNGVMFLGSSASGTNATNNLNTSSDRPALAPLWDDQKTSSSGNVNYKLTGTSPNRVLTVEWLKMLWYYSAPAASDVISYQVKLYETSNRIEFIYNQGATAVYSGSPGASIGISGTTSGDYYSLSDVSASPTASKTTETSNISSKPASGQIYRWDPVACSGTPTAGSAAASVTSGCSSYTTALSLSGATGGCGITYQWQSSPDNSTWSNIAGATSVTYTATVSSNTYYRCVLTCAGSSNSASVYCTATTTPSNDACASAISLGTVSTTTSTAGTNVCASADKSSSCHSPTDNVWYSFTVPAGGGSYSVSVTAGSITYPCLTVYSGACGSLTSVACTYGSSTSANCLAAGTYYINVDDDYGSEGTFTLTVTQTVSGATIPSNDACGSAINLGTVSTTTTTTGSNMCATADKSSNCHSPTENVWYKFTVPAGGGSYSVSVSGGTITSPCLTVYSGNCSGLTNVSCDYSSPISASCLAAGTYYINVDDDYGTAGTFSLTVTMTSAGTSVSNDACASAISLGTVSTTTTTTGSNSCATADKSSSCHSPTDNVWYTFTVPAGGGSYNVSVIAGTMTYPTISVYSGTCGSLTGVKCAYGYGSSVSLDVNCLAAGTYYINVDDDYGTEGTFSLTVTQTISGNGAPANNDCAGAINLTPGAACTQTAGNVACATQSQAGCTGTANDDVWYKFTAAATTQYINVTCSSSFDGVVQVFSGACGSLTSIWCNDGSYSSGSSGSVAATGLTVGNVYYVRVYDYGSSAPTTTTFSICITNPPSCPGSLGTGVTNIPSLPYSALGATTCGAVNDITSVNVTNICGSSSYYGGEDAVYTFTPTTTGVVTITQSNTSGSVGMMLYSGCPFSGTCVADAQNSDASRTICTTLTAGVTYYLIMDSYPSPNCYLYDLSITAPVAGTAAGTDCASADPVTSLPYYKTGLSTCCKVDDYTSSDACASVYMDGEDYIFSYTPAANIVVDITLANTLASTGLFITTGCPNSGTCLTSATGASGNPSLCGVSLTGGVTYYIIVDTDPNPSCTPFDISILENTSATTCNLAYAVSTIPFDSSDPLSTGTVLSFPDDHFATAYTNIGFNFCFDGIQYTQLLVSSNAYLIFDPLYCSTNLPGSNATPSSYSAWSISGAIPNTTNAPRNAILGPWHDIDPGVSGNIRYATYGSAPNRRFVVSYDNVAMYSCNSILFSGQIKLFETTNNIEVHLASKNLCTSWNSGQAILGLHNYNGTIAVVPSGGYNAPTQWIAANKAWQFTTSCSTCLTLLPVDVTSFTGKKYNDAGNILEWKTSLEKEVKDFVLDRSSDGSNFITIDVQHARNIRSGSSYSFVDNVPDKTKTYYYRLTSFDINGSTKKSGLVAVERKSYTFAPFSLYPNPATNAFVIEAEVNEPGKVKVVTYDLFGKLIGEKAYDLENGFNALEFPLENYPAGMYYVKVVSADDSNKQLFVQKIVKQ